MTKAYNIIGAGLSGLRIGQLLASKGNRVEVFEKDDRVGGLMQTERKNGFLFDIGPHIFFKDYADEYRNFIGDDLHNLQVLYGVGFNRRDIISPIRPLNLLSNLGLGKGAPLVWDVLQHKLLQQKRSAGLLKNAEEWVITNFGRQVYKYFFKDYIPKVMGQPASCITAEWGTERHKFYKEHNLWQKSAKFLLDFMINKENRGGFLNVYYPEEGAQQVPDALCQVIKQQDGKVNLDTSVQRIIVQKGRVTHLQILKDGVEEEISIDDTDTVINTMPITDLFAALQDANISIDNLKRKSGQLQFRSLYLFNFIIRKEQLKDKAQIYFPEKKYIFKRVYEPKNLLLEPAPSGQCAICVEVCFNDDDAVGKMDESEIFAEVMEGLRDFYRIRDEDVIEMWVKKVPYAYSIYEIGYREKLQELAAYLMGIGNLISFGRQGTFRYNHMTNRVMDSCQVLMQFFESGKNKKDFLGSPDPKADFF
jgi:protoporphyrinogen oxidase